MTRLAIPLLTVIALVMALPSADAFPPGWQIRTYPTCDVHVRPKPEPDRSCVKDDHFGTVFISRTVPLSYRLCWRRPDGQHGCVKKRRVDPQVASTVALYKKPHRVGTWRLKWLKYPYGRVVAGRAKLHVQR
jgi:hypothetical protein